MTAEPNKVRAIMEKENLPWRSFVFDKEVKALWNDPPTPSFFVLDHKGTICHRWVGNPGAKAMDDALEKLIGAVK